VNGYEKEYRLGLYEKALPAGMTLPRKLVCAAECGFNWLELSVDETEERLARLEWTAAERRALAEGGEDETGGEPVALETSADLLAIGDDPFGNYVLAADIA